MVPNRHRADPDVVQAGAVFESRASNVKIDLDEPRPSLMVAGPWGRRGNLNGVDLALTKLLGRT